MQVVINLSIMHPSDASVFRDHLFDKGMSSASVRRVFASVKSIINLAIREHGLNCTNVFAELSSLMMQPQRRDFQYRLRLSKAFKKNAGLSMMRIDGWWPY